MVHDARPIASSGYNSASSGIVPLNKDALRMAVSICRNYHLAEEAVQDAMISIVCRGRFTNRGEGSFKAWFNTVVCNSARNALLKESRLKAREKRYISCQQSSNV